MHWHNVIETIWAFVHCFFRARFVVLRLDRGNAIAPQTLVTATVCSSRTSKQLYRGRFWRLEWLIWWFWPVFSRATTKKGQLFGFAPPPIFSSKTANGYFVHNFMPSPTEEREGDIRKRPRANVEHSIRYRKYRPWSITTIDVWSRGDHADSRQCGLRVDHRERYLFAMTFWSTAAINHTELIMDWSTARWFYWVDIFSFRTDESGWLSPRG